MSSPFLRGRALKPKNSTTALPSSYQRMRNGLPQRRFHSQIGQGASRLAHRQTGTRPYRAPWCSAQPNPKAKRGRTLLAATSTGHGPTLSARPFRQTWKRRASRRVSQAPEGRRAAVGHTFWLTRARGARRLVLLNAARSVRERGRWRHLGAGISFNDHPCIPSGRAANRTALDGLSR